MEGLTPAEVVKVAGGFKLEVRDKVATPVGRATPIGGQGHRWVFVCCVLDPRRALGSGGNGGRVPGLDKEPLRHWNVAGLAQLTRRENFRDGEIAVVADGKPEFDIVEDPSCG